MSGTFKEKLIESLTSILPIALIILILCATLTPLDTGIFALFFISIFLLIIGMGAFTLGADMSLLVIGEKIGSSMTRSRKVWLIALLSFIIGIIVTVAEPDLKILSDQVGSLKPEWGFFGKYLLIFIVALGVGIFLMLAMLRIVFRIRLSILLIVFYVAAFVLSFFCPTTFRAVAFDSGGVTTGPMTVPFIMSLGVGVAVIRSDKKGQSDSFGLVALASIGPIIAVLILGVIFQLGNITPDIYEPEQVATTWNMGLTYLKGFGNYAEEVAIAVAPILVFSILFQLITRAFHKKQLVKIGLGFLYTFIGLVLFLTGANVGFKPVGTLIGESLASKSWSMWLLIPVGMIIGYFVVAAEPAVHVLNKQVERMSSGAVSSKAMKYGLCIGVCIAIGLAMMRILTGIDIMWILIPGYVVALILTFFTPPMFTGIAFDSGGVASGAMVSSFVLPMAIGACNIINSEAIMTQAFGCVAFVALAPLISIQILGIVYKQKTKRIKRTFLAVEDRVLEYEVD